MNLHGQWNSFHHYWFIISIYILVLRHKPQAQLPSSSIQSCVSPFYGNGGGGGGGGGGLGFGAGYATMRAMSGSSIGYGVANSYNGNNMRREFALQSNRPSSSISTYEPITVPPHQKQKSLPATPLTKPYPRVGNPISAVAAARSTIIGRLAASGIGGNLTAEQTHKPPQQKAPPMKTYHSMSTPSSSSYSPFTYNQNSQAPAHMATAFGMPAYSPAATAAAHNHHYSNAVPSATATTTTTTTRTATPTNQNSITNSNLINTNSSPKPFYNASPLPTTFYKCKFSCRSFVRSFVAFPFLYTFFRYIALQ